MRRRLFHISLAALCVGLMGADSEKHSHAWGPWGPWETEETQIVGHCYQKRTRYCTLAPCTASQTERTPPSAYACK